MSETPTSAALFARASQVIPGGVNSPVRACRSVGVQPLFVSHGDGCHITSMAGTWLSLTKGFGGMRIRKNTLYFNPFLPEQWKSYSFRIEFRGRVIKVKVSRDGTETVLESGDPLDIYLKEELVHLK